MVAPGISLSSLCPSPGATWYSLPWVAISLRFGPVDTPLLGRVVLVTGAARGIGASVALAAARAGADVAVNDLSVEALADVVGRVRALTRRSAAFQADVSDRAQVRTMVDAIEEHFGQIDGLVNNAGIMPYTPFLEIDEQTWQRVLQTDLNGAFNCSQAVLPGMLSRGRGSIVMIASRIGQIGWPQLAHYAAAKAGMIALGKSLAREFGPKGIRVNSIAPGVTNTEMGHLSMGGEVGRHRLAELPLGRFAEPEEVAEAVLFLLSDSSSLFLGQTLNPNGGGYMP